MESALAVISRVMVPSPLTTAKSLTLRSSRLTILGVPLLRFAISSAPSAVIGIFRIEALRDHDLHQFVVGIQVEPGDYTEAIPERGA